MLARDTTTDVFDEIREQIRANRPWSFWRPPHGMGGLVDRLTTMEFPRPAVKSLPPSMNYRTRVVRALEAIESGRVDKVVVARQEVLPPADPVATLDALARNFPDCWVFAVSDGRDTFLGATPELLARFEERRLETCALAGSAAPGDDSLLRSPLYLTASSSGLTGFLHLKRWSDASRDSILAALGLATRQDQLKALHLLHQLEGRLDDLQFNLERPETAADTAPKQG